MARAKTLSILVLVAAGLIGAAPVAHAAAPYLLSRDADTSAIAVSPDWTVYGRIASDGQFWRLRPSDLRPLRLARAGAPREAGRFALMPDGALLVADGHRVWRQMPGRTASLVAGSDTHGTAYLPPSPDPGPLPALTTTLCVGPMAATPTGLVFVDQDAFIRRLRDGAVTTIATLRSPADPRDCYPGEPPITDLAAVPGGALYALTGYSDGLGQTVWRMPTDGGAPESVYRGRGILSLAAERDGALLMGRLGSVTRWRPGAQRSERIGTSGLGDHELRAVPSPDGGILVIRADDSTAASLYYVPPATRPGRTAVGLQLAGVRQRGRRLTMPFRVTRAARATLSLQRVRGPVTGRRRGTIGAGNARLTVRTSHRIVEQTVRVEVRSSDGQRAAQSVQLWVGEVLALDDARAAIVPGGYDIANCDFAGRITGTPPPARAADCSQFIVDVRPGACRRIGPRQVECGYSYQRGKTTECRRVAERITIRGTAVTRDEAIGCDAQGQPRLPRRPLALPGGAPFEPVPEVTAG